jgi:hypothetical protein
MGGHRVTLAGVALSLAGCMSVHGPCHIEVDRGALESRALVECQAGGVAIIVTPAMVFDATRRAIAASAQAASAAQ